MCRCVLVDCSSGGIGDVSPFRQTHLIRRAPGGDKAVSRAPAQLDITYPRRQRARAFQSAASFASSGGGFEMKEDACRQTDTQ